MLIDIKHIYKSYNLGEKDISVLHNISLGIKEQEYVALMGPSGSGKSTMMNILGCLDWPSKGHYFLDGIDVSTLQKDKLAEIRRNKIGFIFQTFNLISSLTAFENVELPLIYNRIQDRSQKVKELLDLVGLSHRFHHYPNQMSGGERQRVAIARSLVNNPKLILADEPTGNLDSKSGEQILKMLKDLHKAQKTILIITHDENVAKKAERVIHLRDGQLFGI